MPNRSISKSILHTLLYFLKIYSSKTIQTKYGSPTCCMLSLRLILPNSIIDKYGYAIRLILPNSIVDKYGNAVIVLNLFDI